MCKTSALECKTAEKTFSKLRQKGREHVHELENYFWLKHLFFLNYSYTIPIKITSSLRRKNTNILKLNFMWKYKDPKITKPTLNK